MEDWYSRTSLLVSGGSRVLVGSCDADGVVVYYWNDNKPFGSVGVGASRKFAKTLDPRSLAPIDPLEFVPRSEFEEFKTKVGKILRLP